MIVDFIGSWIVEVICKYLFADLAPKAIVTRGRERREARRAEELRVKQQKEQEEEEKRQLENIAELEREKSKLESKKRR